MNVLVPYNRHWIIMPPKRSVFSVYVGAVKAQGLSEPEMFGYFFLYREGEPITADVAPLSAEYVTPHKEVGHCGIVWDKLLKAIDLPSVLAREPGERLGALASQLRNLKPATHEPNASLERVAGLTVAMLTTSGLCPGLMTQHAMMQDLVNVYRQ